ncbi:hypothetical protein HDU98_009261 [Podochytrium sp. JEL0797]|nr:hypothetical protein HDU98_009261 [Podochytrium sp. JEL0797]
MDGITAPSTLKSRQSTGRSSEHERSSRIASLIEISKTPKLESIVQLNEEEEAEEDTGAKEKRPGIQMFGKHLNLYSSEDGINFSSAPCTIHRPLGRSDGQDAEQLSNSLSNLDAQLSRNFADEEHTQSPFTPNLDEFDHPGTLIREFVKEMIESNSPGLL